MMEAIIACNFKIRNVWLYSDQLILSDICSYSITTGIVTSLSVTKWYREGVWQRNIGKERKKKKRKMRRGTSSWSRFTVAGVVFVGTHVEGALWLLLTTLERFDRDRKFTTVKMMWRLGRKRDQWNVGKVFCRFHGDNVRQVACF